jgi:hypothetical protein
VKSHIQAALLAAALISLGAACSKSSRQEVTPEIGVTPSSDTPAHPTGLLPQGRLFVYSIELATANSASRSWPTVAIRAYQIDSRRDNEVLRFGGIDDFPVASLVTARYAVYATEPHVVRVDLASGAQTELYHIGPGDRLATVQDIDVSPDGKTLAIVTGDCCGRPDEKLMLLDLESGRETLAVVRSDPRLAGLSGYFWKVHWRDDGAGVVVQTGTSSERPGSTVTVLTSGVVRRPVAPGYDLLAPSGRAVTAGQGTLGCMLISSRSLAIADLDSGLELAAISDPSKAFTAWAWSPDGRELLFQERDYAESDACAWVEHTPRYFVLTLAGVRAVDDLSALFRRWYGEHLVSLQCGPEDSPILSDRWQDQHLLCFSDVPGKLMLNDAVVSDVGVYADVHVLGFR